MLDARAASPGSRARTDVSVVLVADGGEAGLPAAVGAVLASLDRAAHGGDGGRLRGDRLGGEIVLAVRDVAALPPGLPRGDTRLRVVAVPGAGGGRARNLGVGAARGRYVLLTTADARVPADWAAAMVEPLRTGRADLVAGATVGERGPVPSAAGAFPPASCGAARAVLESLGFDDALGRGRYSDTAVTAVFREDAVGAGFRVRVVPGVPVEVPDAPPGRRARAAGARAEGRTAAYLDRHVHVRPAARSRVALLAGLAAAVLRLAGLVVVRGLDAPLPARADVARECEALRLARVPDRDRPRSPAGDAPGGAGGARAAVPVALVARLSVPPTVLPVLSPEPGRDRVAPRRPGRSGEVGAPARGVAHLLWPSARGAAARRPMPPGTLPPRSAAAP